MPTADTLTPVSQAVLPAPEVRARCIPSMAAMPPMSHASADGSLPLMVIGLDESEWPPGRQHQDDAYGTMAGIELVLEGTIALVQDGRHTLVTTGQVLVHRAGVAQVLVAHGGRARTLRLGLDGPLAGQLIAGLPQCIVPVDRQETGSAFADLRQLVLAQPPGHQVRASAIAYHLLLSLSLAARTDAPAANLTPTIAAALHILQTSGARDLDVRQVARTVGTSVSHLHRLFKEALGTSPLRYARERLIAQARHALSTTSLPCQEIAKRLGYDDPLYFSAVFKRITGVSPREFRKRYR